MGNNALKSNNVLVTSDIINGDMVLSQEGRSVLSVSDEYISGEMPLDYFSVSASSGDILVPYTLPQAEYMYGCAATSAGMLLAYYDTYGYMGYDMSNLIQGTITIDSRGTDGNKYDMDAFDTVLGKFIASEDYVSRFYEKTPEQELQYSFINGGTELNTSIWNCLCDYLGTGQYWRDCEDLSTLTYFCTLNYLETTSQTFTVTNGGTSRTLSIKYGDLKSGLSMYVKTRGFSLDAFATETELTDNKSGGTYSFSNYMAEIDAGRLVLISLNSAQAGGHMVVGYGYNEATQEIIFDDTYDSGKRMSWNGTFSYAGYNDFTLYSITTIVFDTSNLHKITSSPVIQITASSTFPTNKDVTVSATFSDSDGTIVSKRYRIDSGQWTTYTTPVVMQNNGVITFEAVDNDGNTTTESYTVNNIDRIAPNAPTVTASTTAKTNKNVTVFASFSNDTVRKEYSLDNQTWQLYSHSVVMNENGTVWFRGSDSAGNISETTSIVISNIDKIAPGAPVVTASTTVPTNQDVTIIATFDNDTFTGQYSTNYQTWNNYTQAITMTKNGTIWFRAIDEAGNISKITSIVINNIDKVAPNAPVVTANTTAPTNQDVIVTATFAKDAFSKQYSYDNLSWNTYEGPLSVENNGTVWFRAIDEAGNCSKNTAIAISNIDKITPDAPTVILSTTRRTAQPVTFSVTTSKPSAVIEVSENGSSWKRFSSSFAAHENGTYSFRAVDKVGNISETTTIGIDTIIESDNWDDMANAGSNGAVADFGPMFTIGQNYSDSIGTSDRADYLEFTLDSAASLSFSIFAAVSGNFAIYQLTERTDKKGAITYSRKSLQSTKFITNTTIESKSLLLTKGTYYIGIENTDKKISNAAYTFTLNSKTVFFTRGDTSDNWATMKTDGAAGLTATAGRVASSGKITDGWVGYGDAIDYTAFTLESAANLIFNITATDAAKFTLCELVSKTDPKGNTTYSLKKLQSSMVKAGGEATTKGTLLQAGTYYLSMESSNATKGGSADYSVSVTSASAFFTKGDNSDDWTTMQTEGTAGLDASLGTLFSSGELVSGWVGYGDSIDYSSFTLETSASLVFDVNATDAAKFTLYELTSKTSPKGTAYSLKKLQNAVIKGGIATTTKETMLAAGTYYLAIEATNAKKGGSADYSISLSDKSVFFPAGDNSDDSWKDAVNLPELALGDTWNGWVGYGDATDFVSFTVNDSTPIVLFFNEETENAIQTKKLKLSCVDSNGKTVLLTSLSNGTVCSKKNLTAGTYFLGATCANVKKDSLNYSISLA